MSRRALLAALAACPIPLPTAFAQEAPYPNRPIRVVLPAIAGSTSDLIMRALAGPLGAVLEQPIVIESKPGAAGRIAIDYVTRAAPDGYTLLMANNGSHSIGPAGNGTRAIEPEKALAPVMMIVRSPIVIAASPKLRIDSIAALVERARAGPGALTSAAGAVGSTSHMASAMLAKRAGIELQHVPYASSVASLRDVLSGEVALMFTQLGSIDAMLRAGGLRAIAVMAERRLTNYPTVETVAEAGYPGLEVSSWYGIVVPPGTPRAVVSRLHSAFARVLAAPELRKLFGSYGMEMVADTPDQFAEAIETDLKRWSEVIHRFGLTPQQ
ncbi:MAG: tripartite tricarboxylate transporter substrate binding protein [Casimicrobiaceae bacterium]